LAPALKAVKGFKAAYVFTDRDTGEGMTFVLYETKEDAEAVDSSGKFKELVAMLGETLVTESVERKVYEVSIQI
jgi:hypothetical protein